MKQLLFLSGKGGTGKTTIACAFIRLSNAKAYADCDVDAPNLHLVMNQSTKAKCSRSDYYGLPIADIDPDLCVRCDLCRQHCCFDAITADAADTDAASTVYKVDRYACEGCGVCEAVCPAGAVSFKPVVTGELTLYVGEAVFSTAQLKMGSGASGKLVAEVKKQMNSAAEHAELAIIDGSPGIGCPVIASLSGADMVLIVAEPSISGISDMERIIRTAGGFKAEIAVCVNKYDTNIENTERIESFCRVRNIPFVGRIPYDREAVKAINNGLSIVDIDCEAGRATKKVFDATLKILFNESERQKYVDKNLGGE